MAQILLTGASGFVGGHLLHELVGQGHVVKALSRSDRSDRALSAAGAQPVRGELTDQASLERAAQDVQAVFHCAANTSAWSKDKALQMDTNVGGTRRLLAAGKRAGIACFVHTSSVSAYSHLVHETLTETVPQRGGESWVNYERSKYLGEQAVRESGVPFLIFNPSHVLGPGDTNNWARLIKLVDQDKLPGVPPGSGAFADVREIAKAQVRAWQLGLKDESFLLGGQHASFLQLVQMAAELCGRKPPVRVMPAGLLMAIGHLSQAFSHLSGRMPQITPASVALTCHHLKVDSSKAIRLLDYRETDLRQLLQDTVEWLRAQGQLRPKPD
jgi:nucleoside-diphosphate-sugar epimerase